VAEIKGIYAAGRKASLKEEEFKKILLKFKLL
jgi:hypothetical protein